MKNVAIVLAGGSGSRMKSDIKKQYLRIGDYPVLWYSLCVFQDCPQINEIVLVCGAEEITKCREQFVEHYGISKIKKIVAGGKERYHSVYEGLKAIGDCDYVLIHDGARPFISADILKRIFDTLERCPACVVGMPVKDTIKISAPDGYVEQTLPREKLWMIQTPQSFSYSLIRRAYDELILQEEAEAENSCEQNHSKIVQNDKNCRDKVSESKSRNHAKRKITDDAMVAETMLHIPVKLIEGSYDNIKITTPEDLILAEALAPKYQKQKTDG
ncbi:MAG: 2-C-methyl-D-erythritol 4-phosphate cytidylyltransferase [Lachnospiraceae bacterium]|nr:2-C-methyl-D-erythritol 4-phosphate cytidylyltransferase [Lachnospiraceae bacterium]